MATKSATDVDQQVGARIRARRQALQISQTALGETLGITFQQVQKYEKGGNRISASRLYAIAEVLKVPVGYFFDGLSGSTKGSDLLANPQVTKLLSAFSAIENEDLRRAIVDIAVVASGMAGAQGVGGTGVQPSGRKRAPEPS